MFEKFFPKKDSLRSEKAVRVIFYYPGEEPSYIEDVNVTLYKSGVVDIHYHNEKVSTHIQNVEIVWQSRQSSLGAKPLRLVKGELPLNQ